MTVFAAVGKYVKRLNLAIECYSNPIEIKNIVELLVLIIYPPKNFELRGTVHCIPIANNFVKISKWGQIKKILYM